MTINKAFLLLAFALSALMLSVLTVLFWAFMSDTVLVPIYYVLWVCGMLVSSVPQGNYLALLVILSMIVGAKTIERLRPVRRDRHTIHNQPDSNTRYLHWRTLCIHANESWFSKGRLAFDARNLILSILAFEQGVDIEEAEAMVRKGMLDIPDVLRNVIETKNIPDVPPNRFAGMLSWLRRPVRRENTNSDPYVEQFLAELISFVEHHLEITTHAGNKFEF